MDLCLERSVTTEARIVLWILSLLLAHISKVLRSMACEKKTCVLTIRSTSFRQKFSKGQPRGLWRRVYQGVKRRKPQTRIQRSRQPLFQSVRHRQSFKTRQCVPHESANKDTMVLGEAAKNHEFTRPLTWLWLTNTEHAKFVPNTTPESCAWKAGRWSEAPCCAQMQGMLHGAEQRCNTS